MSQATTPSRNTPVSYDVHEAKSEPAKALFICSRTDTVMRPRAVRTLKLCLWVLITFLHSGVYNSHATLTSNNNTQVAAIALGP